MLNLMLIAALAGAPQVKPATNSICPVRGHATHAKSPVVVVKGQEYRLCCAECEGTLKADPDKYLLKDGTPKNANPTAHKGNGDHHH